MRADWDAIPPSVRAAIDARLGSPVAEAVNQPAGFSPGPAARCRLADGRHVFVKAAGPELNPYTPDMHRREAAVLIELPAKHPSPRLIDVVDDGDWVAVIIEWINGRTPSPPLDRDDVNRFLSLIERLAVSGAHVHPQGVLSFAEASDGLLGHWSTLAADPPSALDPWSRKHAELLADLEREAGHAARGDTLVHLDARIDNVVFSDRGPDHDVVVDWPQACIGAAWIDLVALAPSLHLDGGPAPDELIVTHPLGATADPHAITVLVAALAGYFTRYALLPAPPGLPTVRAFQAAQGRVTRAWLGRRLGV